MNQPEHSGTAPVGRERKTNRTKRIPAELSRLEAVQTFVEEAFVGETVSEKDICRLLIAFDEIFSNVCRYSNAAEVTVECYMEENKAVLVIEDDGTAFNPLERPQPNVEKSLEEREPGGLGIYMVRKMMDGGTYERKGNRNYLSMILYSQREKQV